jgi:hypothetical protein
MTSRESLRCDFEVALSYGGQITSFGDGQDTLLFAPCGGTGHPAPATLVENAHRSQHNEVCGAIQIALAVVPLAASVIFCNASDGSELFEELDQCLLIAWPQSAEPSNDLP